MSKKQKVILIIAATLAVIALAVVVLGISRMHDLFPTETSIPSVTPLETNSAIDANGSQNAISTDYYEPSETEMDYQSTPEQTQSTTPDATPTPEPTAVPEQHEIEYDYSVVQEQDVIGSTAVGIIVTGDSRVIIETDDGQTFDAGFVGGMPEEDTFLVVFLNHDNTILKAEWTKHGENATPPVNVGMNGYQFYRWRGDYQNITDNTIIAATYIPLGKYYSVTFYDFDTRPIRKEIVTAGGNAVGPAVSPSREGYLFAGWDESLVNVNRNITTTAKYVDTNVPMLIAQVIPSDEKDFVSVTISVKNNPGICAAKLLVSFDSSISLVDFQLNASDKGGSAVGPESKPVKDKATFLWYKYDGDITEDFVFVTLLFDISNATGGRKEISIQYDPDDVFSFNGDNIDFEVITASIDVK